MTTIILCSEGRSMQVAKDMTSRMKSGKARRPIKNVHNCYDFQKCSSPAK